MENNKKHACKKFNELIIQFINDLIKICPDDNSDLNRFKRYSKIVEVPNTKRIIISNYQVYILRDIFVSNILNSNVDFFVNYDFVNDTSVEIKSDYILPLIKKIQNTIYKLQSNNDSDSINTIFKWLTMLTYFAYVDLGINPNEKFQQLKS